MKINEQIIKDYYDSLTPEQREVAFSDMVDYLQDAEAMRWSDDRQELYWESCGDRLGGDTKSE